VSECPNAQQEKNNGPKQTVHFLKCGRLHEFRKTEDTQSDHQQITQEDTRGQYHPFAKSFLNTCMDQLEKRRSEQKDTDKKPLPYTIENRKYIHIFLIIDLK
jgi:hypothetical protein